MPHKAIGIFDSGLGGLTVFKEVRRRLPNEHLIYFGDTARVPYGGKSPETIIRYSKENATFLMTHSIKALVVACHTAASHAAEALIQQCVFPVIDVIEPVAKLACHITKTQRIGIIGTKATIKSGIYRKKIQKYLPTAKVLEVPCPLLVPLVEENFIDHPATRLILREYLKPFKEIDTLVLGCTHYPFLSHIIQEELMDGVNILDSATACAIQIENHLKQESLLSKGDEKGKITFFVSDDPERFRNFAESFLGTTLDSVVLATFE